MPFSLYYLYHSGFALCFDNFTVLIDYFEDSVDAEHGIFHEELLKRPGTLYVLSSHFHQDHFNPLIFDFLEEKEDLRYILSKDIYKKRKKWLPVDDIAFLSVGDTYADQNLSIKAYGSTDVGVSFYFEAGGHKFFHAGDLNNWHWQDESTPEESAGCEKLFLVELKKIKEELPALDVVLFPADPRLGSDYLRGPRQFIEAVPSKVLVPMHFDAEYGKANAMQQIAAERGTSFVELHERGEGFAFADDLSFNKLITSN